MAKDVGVTAIIAARNEADVIRQVVADLARQDIGIYLIDDGSADATVDEARAGAGSALLGVESTPAGSAYAWEDILRRKAELARELPGDWFLHHDADELRESPWRDLGLRDGLALVDRLGWNAVDFAVFKFVPLDDRFEAGADLRTAFTHWAPGDAWDHVQIKAWKRNPEVDLARSGGHEAEFAGRRVFPLRFLLRHYPVRSQAHGERKVFRDRKPRFRAEEVARGWHVQYEGIEPGERFLRSPAELQAWDADQVRVDLLLRHRGVEEIEEIAETRRLDVERLERDAINYRDDLERQRAEVRRLGEDATARDGRLRSLHADLDAAHRKNAELHAALDAARREVASLHPRLDTAARELARLHPRLDGLERQLVVLHEQLDAERRAAAEMHPRLDAAQRQAEQLHTLLDAARQQADDVRRAKDALDRQLGEEREWRDRERRETEALQARLDETQATLAGVRARLSDIEASRSWRWTAPVRRLMRG